LANSTASTSNERLTNCGLEDILKEFFLFPLVKDYREAHQAAIFINSEMKEEAFRELQDFEEEIKFNNLIDFTPKIEPKI
jgi:hypothetical protein